MPESTRLIDMTEDAGTDAPRPELEFSAFFESEHLRLARALYLLTGDPGEADDLAQEALVRVYERWDRVRLMDSPTGYLFRTALNLYRSRLRRLASAARRALRPAPQLDPAQAVEERDEVARALASLPEGQREALILVEWLGMETEEAGQILHIEPVSVRVRLSRARASLRERFGGQDE
jgi:RNA polymerase sigma-70 factor (ECF subfamily)